MKHQYNDNRHAPDLGLAMVKDHSTNGVMEHPIIVLKDYDNTLGKKEGGGVDRETVDIKMLAVMQDVSCTQC